MRELTSSGQSVLTSFVLDCILYTLALAGPQRKRAQATKTTMKVNNIAVFSNFCSIRKQYFARSSCLLLLQCRRRCCKFPVENGRCHF